MARTGLAGATDFEALIRDTWRVSEARRTYVIAFDVSDEDRTILHREALRVLRPVLSSAEIDPMIDSPDQAAVARLHAVAREQGRWPPSRWRLLRVTGVDLDPAEDAHFELMANLSSTALLLDAFDLEGREVFSATDQGSLYVVVTDAQHLELTERLAEHGVPGDVLRPVVS